MKCIVKIMAMPGTRAAVADLCMFGLAACDDGGPGFVNASVRTITNARQVGVRLQSKCNSTHRHARVDAEDVIGKREQTGTWVREAARAIDEELKKDKQELEMREQRKRAEDANRICSIINENADNKGLSLVEAEMGKLMHQDEQELLSVWEGWHWDDNKGGWLDPELCAKARREEVEYIRRHKMYVRVPREVCLRETGKAPIKTGWAETDKGQPGKPNVRARWVAKEYKTHARQELYASTPPLEALKVVLSEIATGEREGKVLALVDVRRAYAPARRKVFAELPPEDYQPGDEHMCGLLRDSLYGTHDAAQNWEEELASTLSGLGLTRGSACPCVWRGRIKGEDIVATVHGDDITIGGQRSAVEFLIKMISRKYEIKKQVLGGDPDFEKSGRKLNRVIEWDRDGIAIEEDQWHVREIMKGLKLYMCCGKERTDADEDKPSTGGMT